MDPGLPVGRRRIEIHGVVQGVGFRPFVARLADELSLAGFVGNSGAGVFIEVEGAQLVLDRFQRRLQAAPPPLAVIDGVQSVPVLPVGAVGFRIVESERSPGNRTLIPGDVATCDVCISELQDQSSRRYRHPFITCTDCGPRFTIIADMPYDRDATTMADFEMCSECRREYEAPLDRRFHAQPISCHQCGPRVWLESGGHTTSGDDEVYSEVQRLLAAGGIVAIKGLGGFHLACDARLPGAIARLRTLKRRPDKPLALMAADVDVVRSVALLSEGSEKALKQPAHPIVLLPVGLPIPGVADRLDEVGVMLPYTPLHHLIFADTPSGETPPPHLLVMTSGNLSEEPICTDNDDALIRLAGIADAFLLHSRRIAVPCDDSVVRPDGEKVQPVRRSRGHAPLPIALGEDGPTVLAVGAELKNTFCLAHGPRAFVSGHIGDMGSLESQMAFTRAVEHLLHLRGARPEVVATDSHPGYASRQWAEKYAEVNELPMIAVQHHHAHVVSLLAESRLLGTPIVGVAYDGTGLGCDQHVWGGELLVVGTDYASFERVEHLTEFALPGGDVAVREPWRLALALLAAAGLGLADWRPRDVADDHIAAVWKQLETGRGCVPTSSVGRLFDGLAALLGVRGYSSYEAQAPAELEAVARLAAQPEALDFGLPGKGGIDWRPAVRSIVAKSAAGVPVADLAAGFHTSLATATADAAVLAARRAGVRMVGLTGGVFANRLLGEQIRAQVERCGLRVLTHNEVPCNDGGLSLGQAMVARASSRSLSSN